MRQSYKFYSIIATFFAIIFIVIACGKDKYILTAIPNNPSYGRVSGGGEYKNGDMATLEAVPYDGYWFEKWSDDMTENPRTIIVHSNTQLTAIFSKAKNYTIDVYSNNNSWGTVSGGGTYPSGSKVTLKATPQNGYSFERWSDGNTSATRTITVTGNATYTAYFKSNGGGGGGGGSNPSYSAFFDGTALDIAGYSDYQCAQQQNLMIYLAQFAKRSEGNSVYFPYLVMYLSAENSPSSLQVYNGYLELYKDTYYTANGNNYGDWQYYSTNSMNCSALDLTSHTLSFTGSYTLYWLADIAENGAANADACTKKILNFTCSNLTFTLTSSKGFHKMNIKK